MSPSPLPVVHVTDDGHNDGNKPANTIDGDASTRWSAEGDGRWILWDLGAVRSVQRVRIAFFKGDQRSAGFDLEVAATEDDPGEKVLSGKHSGGDTTDLETFDFPPTSGRYVRYVGHGNDHGDWNSLTEVEVLGTTAEVDPPVEKHPIHPGAAAQVVAYGTTPSLTPSPVFRVFAGPAEQEIFTAQFTENRTIHFAGFSVGDGSVPIRIDLPHDDPKNVRISPRQRGLQAQVSGHSLRFTLTGPEKLIIFVTTDSGKKLDPLYLYADPRQDPPASDSVNFFFGPGLHDGNGHGEKIVLKSHQKVYIAGGALVKGSITATGATDVQVFGRGILQEKNSEGGTTISMDGCDTVTVEGITVLDVERGWSTHYEKCRNVTIQDVKIFSFGENCDGIDPDGCTTFTVDRCLISTGDDAIAIKSRHAAVADVHILRTIVETYPSTGAQEGGDGIKIGTETFTGPISGIHVEDCDVVRAYGDNGYHGHSAFSIVHRPDSHIDDVTYKNVRVEEVQDGKKNFEIRMLASEEGSDVSADAHNGTVSDVTLEDITWDGERNINLIGAGISGVTFRNCTVAGHPLQKGRLFSDDNGHHGSLPAVTVVP